MRNIPRRVQRQPLKRGADIPENKKPVPPGLAVRHRHLFSLHRGKFRPGLHDAVKRLNPVPLAAGLQVRMCRDKFFIPLDHLTHLGRWGGLGRRGEDSRHDICMAEARGGFRLGG